MSILFARVVEPIMPRTGGSSKCPMVLDAPCLAEFRMVWRDGWIESLGQVLRSVRWVESVCQNQLAWRAGPSQGLRSVVHSRPLHQSFKVANRPRSGPNEVHDQGAPVAREHGQ